MNADALAGGGGVKAGRTNVILHVARAQDAPRVHVFKSGDHFVRGLASRVGHDVEAAAMTHGHYAFDGAMFADNFEHGVEQRDQRGDAFERKAFGAEVAGLQNLLEQIGANEPFENFCLIGFRRHSFHAFGDPLAAFRLGEMHEFRADGVAIEAASLFGDRAGKGEIGVAQRFKKTNGVEGGLVVAPAAEGVENPLAVLLGGCGFADGLCGL